jgi:hypothetical protein
MSFIGIETSGYKLYILSIRGPYLSTTSHGDSGRDDIGNQVSRIEHPVSSIEHPVGLQIHWYAAVAEVFFHLRYGVILEVRD